MTQKFRFFHFFCPLHSQFSYGWRSTVFIWHCVRFNINARVNSKRVDNSKSVMLLIVRKYFEHTISKKKKSFPLCFAVEWECRHSANVRVFRDYARNQYENMVWHDEKSVGEYPNKISSCSLWACTSVCVRTCYPLRCDVKRVEHVHKTAHLKFNQANQYMIKAHDFVDNCTERERENETRSGYYKFEVVFFAWIARMQR